MTNNEFERVFYKNDYSFGVHDINFYMLYGGTNWVSCCNGASYPVLDR